MLAACPLDAAASAPPLLDVYGELPEMDTVTLSPDGRRVAAMSRTTLGNIVMVFTADGRTIYNSSTGNSKVRGLIWVGNDIVLLQSSATVGIGVGFTTPKAELGSTLIIHLDGSKPQQVFAGRRNVAPTTRGYYGTRKIDGTFQPFFGGIAYEPNRVSTYLSNTNSTLFRIDTKTNTPYRVAAAAQDGHWRDWIVGPDGTIAVTLDFADETGAWIIRNAAGEKLASGNDPTGRVNLGFLGRQADTIIYNRKTEAGSFAWYEVSLSGGESRPFMPEVAIGQPYIDPYKGTIIGYLPDGDNAKATFFDPYRQSVSDKISRTFSRQAMELVDWSENFTKVIVHTSGGNGDSGTWYLIDVGSLQATPIGYDHEAITPEQTGPVSRVSYKAADGLDLDGILTLPPGREAKNLPVILLPHGGPASYDSAVFDWWAQAFASRGYAVFQPNFRGSTNRDGTFMRAGNGQWGRKMQTDISDGLAELGRRGVVDRRRACIVGASYGGYAALAGVTLQSGLYRCAVSVAGVSDLVRMYGETVRISGDSNSVRLSLVDQLGDPSKLDEVSPRRFAARADAPVLLIHGKDDTVVPFSQSTQMADALKDAGKPYEFVVLKDEDHWLSRAPTRKQMLQAAMAFVQKYNPAN